MSGILNVLLGDNAAASSFDAATDAWVAAVVGAGGTVSAGRKTIVNNLIVGLKADGLFTKLDRLWLHAAEDTQSALIDLIADASATVIGGPTFTADQGYTFDTLKYLNSNYNPATNGVAYTLNSATLGSYVRTLDSVGSQGFCAETSGGNFAELVNFSGQTGTLLNDGSALIEAGSTIVGDYIATRTASNARAIYERGASIASDTQASVAIPSGNLFIGARNNGGVDQETKSQIAATWIGGGFSSTNASNMSSRINTYMTAIGANVF